MPCPCCGCQADEDCPPCREGDIFVNEDRCCPPGYTFPRTAGTDCCTDATETDCVPAEDGIVPHCCDGVCQEEECAGGLSVPSGPGTELKKLLSLLGIKPEKGCACAKRARYMDRMGCDWCLENMDTIVRWLREEHERRKLLVPFSDLIARQVVKLAVKKARKANSK